MTTHLIVPRRTLRPVRPAAASFLDGFDRMFDELWRGFPQTQSRAGVATAATVTPRIDYDETDTEVRVAAELPGLERENIAVSLEEGVLTIKGERSDETEEGDEAQGFRHVETFRGRFERRLRLGAEIDEEGVKAAYKNGVLTVTLPKVPEVEPEVRTIPVTTD